MKKTLAMSLMFLMTGCACFDGMCGDDEEFEETPVPQNAYKGYDNQGCNYATGENCQDNRPIRVNYYNVQPQRIQPRPIVYRQEQPIIYVKEVEKPTPVIIRQKEAPKPVVIEKTVAPAQTVQTTKTYASCGDIKSTTKEYELNDGSRCAPEVKEVREPVEIVYKKTTYKTVYEPRTSTTVTFEKEPYNQQVKEEVIKTTTTTTKEVVTNTQPVAQNVETVVTTTTTSSTSDLDVLPQDEIK